MEQQTHSAAGVPACRDEAEMQLYNYDLRDERRCMKCGFDAMLACHLSASDCLPEDPDKTMVRVRYVMKCVRCGHSCVHRLAWQAHRREPKVVESKARLVARFTSLTHRQANDCLNIIDGEMRASYQPDGLMTVEIFAK